MPPVTSESDRRAMSSSANTSACSSAISVDRDAADGRQPPPNRSDAISPAETARTGPRRGSDLRSYRPANKVKSQDGPELRPQSPGPRPADRGDGGVRARHRQGGFQ